LETLSALSRTMQNPTIDIDLLPHITTQIGFTSENGLIQNVVRDITSLKIVKIKQADKIETVVRSNPEFLPKLTAENSQFLEKTILFFNNFDNRVQKANCLTSIMASMLNLLSLPEGNVYCYDVPTLTKAMRVFHIFMKNSYEDYGCLNSVLSRLCAEIDLLEQEDGLFYGKREGEEVAPEGPTVPQRQELIRVLFRVLGTSVLISNHQSKIHISKQHIIHHCRYQSAEQSAPSATETARSETTAAQIPAAISKTESAWTRRAATRGCCRSRSRSRSRSRRRSRRTESRRRSRWGRRQQWWRNTNCPSFKTHTRIHSLWKNY